MPIIVKFKDNVKKLKTYIIVRIELSINGNTKRTPIEIILKRLIISEIRCMISRYLIQTIY